MALGTHELGLGNQSGLFMAENDYDPRKPPPRVEVEELSSTRFVYAQLERVRSVNCTFVSRDTSESFEDKPEIR